MISLIFRGLAVLCLFAACGGSATGGGVAPDAAPDEERGAGAGAGAACSASSDCNDGADCTVDSCVDGSCRIVPLDCGALSDGCNAATCIEDQGCVTQPVPDGQGCDDGRFCTDADECSQGRCLGVARDCSTLDGPCTRGGCDEASMACAAVPLPDGTLCEDGLVCTVRTECAAAACLGEPFDCSALDDVCAAGRCDENAGSCVADALGPFPGLEGPLGDPSCANGADDDCNGLVDLDDPVCSCPDCNDGDVCTFDGCDPVTQMCFWTARTIDPASAVLSTSASDPSTLCLVAGSAARALVYADLRDTDGRPVDGATVSIGGAPATESAAQAGIYWREVAAAAAPGSRTMSVDVDWCTDSITLAATVSVTDAPTNPTSGGTGGCSPIDGNVRVRVVAAESGAPIEGASVLVGLVEDAALQHAPEGRFGGAASLASNVAVTDPSGLAEFHDLGQALAAAVTVTAGAPGRAYFSIVDGNASDLVLALPLVAQPPAPTTRYTGGTGNYNDTTCLEWDFALVVPHVQIEALARYDRAAWLGKSRCYDSGSLILGTMVIPENQWVPSQLLGFPPLCLPVNEGTWTLELPDTAGTGATEDVSMDLGAVSLDFVTGGSTLFELLAVTNYHSLGFMLDETVPTPPTNGRSIDPVDDYPNPFSVTFSGQPPETDVVGLAAADYDGTNGTGPLMFLGESVHEWDQGGSTLDIPNSDLDTGGAPTGVRRLAVLAALYLDKGAHPAIPANWIDAVSSVMVRDDGTGGEPFGPGGGTASVSDFLGIASTGFTPPGDFSWGDATTAANTPLYSVHELGVRVRRHLPVIPCLAENEIRESFEAQWIVVKPFAATCTGRECFTLPTLPPSFPRAAAGLQQKSGFLQLVGTGTPCSGPCPVAGEACVDPDGTGAAPAMCMSGAGSDSDPYVIRDYFWQAHVYDLDLAPAFDFNAFDFADRRALVTHESFNRAAFE